MCVQHVPVAQSRRPIVVRESMDPRALAFFNTLTDSQRDMLANMGGMTEQERSDGLVTCSWLQQQCRRTRGATQKPALFCFNTQGTLFTLSLPPITNTANRVSQCGVVPFTSTYTCLGALHTR